jgi:hypothetical protein
MMEKDMKRSLMLAAFAAFSTLAVTGSAFAETQFRIDDETICKLLEAAHESNCDEYELVQIRKSDRAAIRETLAGSIETTGSIVSGNDDEDLGNGDTQGEPVTVPVKR